MKCGYKVWAAPGPRVGHVKTTVLYPALPAVTSELPARAEGA